MSWTTTNKTWSVGEVVTAAMLNTYVRNQFIETAPAKVTTAGDIVYATSSHTLARLGIGSSGQILAVQGGGLPAWFTPPTLRSYHDTTQSIANNSYQALIFNTDQLDAFGIHSTSGGVSSKFQPTTRGVYAVHLSVAWIANSSGTRELMVSVDGASGVRVSTPVNSAAAATYQQAYLEYGVSTTSYFGALAYQNTGAALDLAGNQSVFEMHWLAPA